MQENISRKDWTTTLLLCIFLGVIGGHRFYVGKVGTGILWLLTGGLFGIGALIDLISIICGNFRDSYGAVILSESKKQYYVPAPQYAAPPAQAAPAAQNGIIHMNHIAPEKLNIVSGANTFYSIGIIAGDSGISEIALNKYSYGRITGTYSATAFDVSPEAILKMLGTQSLLVGYDIRSKFHAFALLLKDVSANAEWDYVDLKECAQQQGINYTPKSSAIDEAQAAAKLFRELCEATADSTSALD